MSLLTVPVRFHDETAKFAMLELDSVRTALMLVDCYGDCGPANNRIIEDKIAPVLISARKAGMKVIYFHNAAGGEGGPLNISRELHGTRHGYERLGPPGWKPSMPDYLPAIAPLETEAEFQKADRNGFRDTFADQYLKTWGVDTLVAVGFSLRSCLYHTCIGAMEHNYRVILLRDCTSPPGANEFPDTLDKHNPEGGWMRYSILRLFETNEGYTSTSHEFIEACLAVSSGEAKD